MAAYRPLCRIVLLTALLTLPASEASAQVDGISLAEAEQAAFRRAALKAGPSVVRIETVGGVDKLGDVMLNTGSTTGTIVGPGLILSSAYNLAGEPSAIFVTLDDGRRVAADRIATDEVRQLVLLEAPDAADRPPIASVDLDRMRVGDWTIALGRTYGQSVPSISAGLLSARSRLWGVAIQTDAKVSPVNYGGPLVDLSGRAIGILVPLSPQDTGRTAGLEWYDSGIGFAIPMADAIASARRLKSGDDALPGRLGLAIAGSGLVGEPAEIERLHPLGPADSAGLAAGDRIVAIEGSPVETAADFRRAIAGRYAGETLAVRFERIADEQTVVDDVTLELAADLPTYEFPQVGLLAESDGTVRAVLAEGPKSVQPGDRLTAIDGKPADTAAGLIAEVCRFRVGDPIDVTLMRGGEERTESVTLGPLATKLPDDLATPPGDEVADNETRGRIKDRVEGTELDYVAYLPEAATGRNPCGLLISLDGGDPIDKFRVECEKRNVALLVPTPDESTGGFTAEDLDDLQQAVAAIAERVPLDASRIAVLAGKQSCPLAVQWASRKQSPIRGLILHDPVLRTPPSPTDNSRRLLWALPSGDGQTLTRLRSFLSEAKHPVTELSGELTPAELTTWVDFMGRL